MDKELDYFRNIDFSNEFEPVEFSIEDYDPEELDKLIDELNDEFEPVEFSIEDYDPEELDKLIDELNDELEIALEKAEKQLFTD